MPYILLRESTSENAVRESEFIIYLMIQIKSFYKIKLLYSFFHEQVNEASSNTRITTLKLIVDTRYRFRYKIIEIKREQENVFS